MDILLTRGAMYFEDVGSMGHYSNVDDAMI